MKRTLTLLTIALLMCSTVLSSELSVTIETKTTSGTVTKNARQVTFIFGSTYTGMIAGVPFVGGAGADASLTITAPSGDKLGAISYTVTGGTLRIVELGNL